MYVPNVFNALYCKFRLVQLCPVFADPVTIPSIISFMLISVVKSILAVNSCTNIVLFDKKKPSCK